MARPKPCAGAGDDAVRPAKSWLIERLRRRAWPRPAVEQGRPALARPASRSWISSTRRAHDGQPRGRAGRRSGGRGRAGRRSRCAACAPRGRARCRCGVLAERRLKATMSSKRALERRVGCAGPEGARVEAVEGLEADALGGGHARDLAAELDQDRAMAPVVQHVGDRIVGQRGGEQQRAVDQLAPEIAPDVGGEHGVRLEALRRARGCARCAACGGRRARPRPPRRGRHT